MIFYGKPHRPIYERAMALAAEQRGVAGRARPRAGDRRFRARPDLAGAHGFGIDCLFVTRGIHAEDFEGIDQLDPASVKELFGHPPRRSDAGVAVVRLEAAVAMTAAAYLHRVVAEALPQPSAV